MPAMTQLPPILFLPSLLLESEQPLLTQHLVVVLVHFLELLQLLIQLGLFDLRLLKQTFHHSLSELCLPTIHLISSRTSWLCWPHMFGSIVRNAFDVECVGLFGRLNGNFLESQLLAETRNEESLIQSAH